jgi:hypothetical protein
LNGHPLKTEIFSSSSILHIGGSYSKWPTTLPLTLFQIEYAESSIRKELIIVVETEWQDISQKIEDFVSIGHIVYKKRVVIAIDAEANDVSIYVDMVLTIDLTSIPISHATMTIAGVLQVMRIQ